MTDTKICGWAPCGRNFQRNPKTQDSVWKQQEYCGRRCQNKAWYARKGRNARHASRVEKPKETAKMEVGGLARLGWQGRALCRDEDPELFFAVGTSGPALLQNAEAKAVCQRCPVINQCLAYAIDTGQPAGVWGGMDEEERRLLKAQLAS